MIKLCKYSAQLLSYFALVIMEWYLFFVEKSCFVKGGILAVAILYTSPIIILLAVIVCELLKKAFLRMLFYIKNKRNTPGGRK